MKKIYLSLLFITITIILSIQTSSDSTTKIEEQTEEVKILKEVQKYLPLVELSKITSKYLMQDLILFSKAGNSAKLLKYLDNGKLDQSFGQNGIASSDIEHITSLVSTSNGKIVVLGGTKQLSIDAIPCSLYIACYNANGSLDKTFGDGKGLIVDDKLKLGQNSHLALDPNGKIIVNNDNGDLVRFDSNGNFDQNFTIKLQDLSSSTILSDGKIIVADLDHSYKTINIKSYLNNEEANKIFGENAKYNTEKIDTLGCISSQNDGKILISGNRFIIRFLNNGELDLSFGNEKLGISKFDFFIKKMLVQDDEKILIAGTCHSSDYHGKLEISSLKLIRLLPNGTIDNTFNANDILQEFFKNKVFLDQGDIHNTSSENDIVNANLENDIVNANIQIITSNLGKIIVGGTFANVPFMFKFNDDGTFDKTFVFQQI